MAVFGEVVHADGISSINDIASMRTVLYQEAAMEMQEEETDGSGESRMRGGHSNESRKEGGSIMQSSASEPFERMPLDGTGVREGKKGEESDVGNARRAAEGLRNSKKQWEESSEPDGVENTTLTSWELLTDVSFQVYVAVHVLALLTLLLIPCSPSLLLTCCLSYSLRMFGITAGYHRLLSHRSFRTSRVSQFAFALLGCLAFQKGPLWWASHHRHHHRTADTEQDSHSPVQWGFFWSHMGWFLCSKQHAGVLWGKIPDLAKYPELQLLDRYHFVPPLSLAFLLLLSGGVASAGWGFMLATILCWHATYCINSIAHLVGSRRFRCEFNTHCDARNNLLLAIATLGEGWHNNHHCYMRSAKHGFYDHEVDVTWYLLLLFHRLGIVWDLQLPPIERLEQERFDTKHLRCRCKEVEADLREMLVEAEEQEENNKKKQ